MSQFYEIDSTKVSHAEIFWWYKSPLVIIPWLNKWLRVRTACSSDDPPVESTFPFLVATLPPEIAAGFEPLAQELAGFGFGDPVYYVIADPGSQATIYWAVFRHQTGNYFARIHQRFWQRAQKHDRGLFPMFFTAFRDGTFLVSSAGKPDMAAPATVQMNRMFKALTGQLWQKHQKLTIAEKEKFILPAESRDDLVTLTEQHHILVRDFHLARGVFRPRTETEQAETERFTGHVAAAQAAGLQYPEVMAELKKLQEKKGGWAAAGWMLVISFVLFVVVGAARWNWQFTLLIIPVLFFHECGHWVAMRMFNYRNLRMFFIPFFGAAVTGRNWNVPGWQKALVSLAGPLPGIALGVIVGVMGLVSKKPLVNEFALLLVFVNGLNLLPVLPLDGGRVLQTILFCRNRWLNVTFQILAIIGLFLLGIGGMGRIFVYLAIITAITLPVLIRLGGVTDKLRDALPPPPPGSDEIPPATAEVIITEVKAAFPKNASNKVIAQHTLSVFETLNARPPGALATIGLMTLHGGAFLLAIVFSLLLFVGKNGGGLADFARAAMRQPQLAYHCGEAQQWHGADANFTSRNVLVATFKRPDLAAAEYKTLTGELPAASRLTLFGESLMLTLPTSDDAAREKWYGRLQAATTNVFVMVSNQPALVNFIFIAPTTSAATNLSADLTGYLSAGSSLHLIAPWSPAARLPGFAAFRYARQEWLQIDLAVGKATEDDPELKNYYKKIAAARKRGAEAEADRLEEERRQLVQKLQVDAGDQLAATATNPVVGVLVGLHKELAQLDFTNRVDRAAVERKIAANLGEIPYEDDKPSPAADAAGAFMGEVSRHSLMVEISWMQLNDPETGLPDLADWLCGQGCIGIKYDVSAGFNGTDDE